MLQHAHPEKRSSPCRNDDELIETHRVSTEAETSIPLLSAAEHRLIEDDLKAKQSNSSFIGGEVRLKRRSGSAKAKPYVLNPLIPD